MLVLDFLKWWYGEGWVLRFRMLIRHIENWLEYFSVGILLRTLFSPWRQTITIAGPDQAVSDAFSAFVGNLISRMVGFWVRIFALIAGAVTVLFVLTLNTIYILIWPVIPVASPLIIAIGVLS